MTTDITADHTTEEQVTKNHDDHHSDDHHDDHAHHDTNELALFGFWIYIMSDCILFATLFAVFAVLSMTAGSYGQILPTDILKLDFVAAETALLLLSSFTFGMGMLGAYAESMKRLVFWLGTTWLLGFGFICMELYEFSHLIHEGAGPQTGGYWSGFFGLIGTHGIHVTAGLLWMIVMVFHFKREGFSSNNMARLSMLSLFWHFLDIIWICVFSFVYLFGAL